MEQKARMERLFKKINPESDFHGDQKEYEDNLWYFFQSAWHLKDWIKADTSLQPFDIESIANSIHSLRLCADIANRTKHLEINNIREDARPDGNDVTIYLGPLNLPTNEDHPDDKIHISQSMGSIYKYYVTDISGTRYSTIELAEQIMKDWDEVINSYVKPKI